MALAFVQSNSSGNSSGTPQANLTVSLTGVTAGNLIVIFAKHEEATTTISVSDGTDTFSTGTYFSNAGSDSHGQFHYLPVANGGSITYTATFGASRAFPSLFVFEYSYSAGTVAFDGEASSNATSTGVTSTNYTTTGTDGVAFGGYAESTGNTTSSELVNGVGADGAIRSPGGNFSSAWRKTYSAGFTGASTATLSGSFPWACGGFALRIDPAGPTITDQPDPQTVYEGQVATFTITATSSGGTLHYQWKDDGGNVGTDSSTYAPTTTLAMNGSLITCDVTDDNGTTPSASATLTVIPSSTIAWTRA